MFDGFDPRLRDVFLHRRRRSALVYGALLTAGATALSIVLVPPPVEETVVVALEPKLEDFAVETAEQEEIEPDPAPAPPPKTKIKIVRTPKRRPKRAPPKRKVQGGAQESATEKTVEVGEGDGHGQPGTGDGKATRSPKPRSPKPKPLAKPKPRPKSKPRLDPSKPVDRPGKASAPKPLASNRLPAYPKALRDKGITGSVLVKLHVHRDGSVRGAKVLRKRNNATTEAEQERANALFLKAVIAAIKTWKYTPAKLDGEAITVWHKVNIPFSLTAD